jgi:hypothetical protein
MKQSFGSWISVDSCLPEEDDVLGAPGITESNPVLVTVRLAAYGFDSPAVSIAYTRNGEWVLSAPELVAQSLRVIAWMPLPEPAHESEQDAEKEERICIH